MSDQNLENIKDVKGRVTLSREETRTWLAKGVVFIFAGTLVVAGLADVFTETRFDDFNILISALSGLFGVVLGFYFGKESGG